MRASGDDLHHAGELEGAAAEMMFCAVPMTPPDLELVDSALPAQDGLASP